MVLNQSVCGSIGDTLESSNILIGLDLISAKVSDIFHWKRNSTVVMNESVGELIWELPNG